MEKFTKAESAIDAFFDQAKKTKQFVLFTINEHLFGVPVEQVSSVQNFDRLYEVPGVPDYVLGVTNIRGRVITLINLKKRLKLEVDDSENYSGHIIFIEIGEQTVGMLVDRVLSLKSVPLEYLKEDLDLINTKIDTDFLKGAASMNEDEKYIVILLNLDRVLSEYEIKEITQQAQQKELLEKALEKKEKVVLSDEKLQQLNLEQDDFEEYSDEE